MLTSSNILPLSLKEETRNSCIDRHGVACLQADCVRFMHLLYTMQRICVVTHLLYTMQKNCECNLVPNMCYMLCQKDDRTGEITRLANAWYGNSLINCTLPMYY